MATPYGEDKLCIDYERQVPFTSQTSNQTIYPLPYIKMVHEPDLKNKKLKKLRVMERFKSREGFTNAFNNTISSLNELWVDDTPFELRCYPEETPAAIGEILTSLAERIHGYLALNQDVEEDVSLGNGCPDHDLLVDELRSNGLVPLTPARIALPRKGEGGVLALERLLPLQDQKRYLNPENMLRDPPPTDEEVEKTPIVRGFDEDQYRQLLVAMERYWVLQTK